jgi:hypothetical protein
MRSEDSQLSFNLSAMYRDGAITTSGIRLARARLTLIASAAAMTLQVMVPCKHLPVTQLSGEPSAHLKQVSPPRSAVYDGQINL